MQSAAKSLDRLAQDCQSTLGTRGGLVPVGFDQSTGPLFNRDPLPFSREPPTCWPFWGPFTLPSHPPLQPSHTPLQPSLPPSHPITIQPSNPPYIFFCFYRLVAVRAPRSHGTKATPRGYEPSEPHAWRAFFVFRGLFKAPLFTFLGEGCALNMDQKRNLVDPRIPPNKHGQNPAGKLDEPI